MGLFLDLFYFCFGSVASLTEKEGIITFLQEELREVREKKAVHEVRLLLQTPGFSVENTSL